MASNDGGEKTEQPTPRRRQEAREEGQIAKSMDLTAAVAILSGLILLKVFGPGMFNEMLGMTRGVGHESGIRAGELIIWIRRVGWAAAKMLLPFLTLLVLITVAGTVAQSGLLLTWKKLTPKADKLNPISGFKRLFSTEALARLAFGLLKIAIIAYIAYLTIVGDIGTVLSAGTLHTGGVFSMSASMMFNLALRMAIVLLILGVADYAVQRWKLERELRMTKQEVRDELKRMEGDPLLKQRRRQMQSQLAMQRVQAEVPGADVVVTNPTHYAVALKYDEGAMPAPRVVAKGQDFLAQRIREIAQLHGVPVVQRPPLARGLYHGVEVGQEVPPEYYRAVAEVLAYVYQLNGKAAS